MSKTFLGHNRPILVGSIRQPTAKDVLADIKNCEHDGADAFILHIQLMEEEYHNFDCLKQIADSTSLPIMAINYPNGSGQTDEERTQIQKEAVRAGFACVDICANTFDHDSRSSLTGCRAAFAAANPAEISMRPEIIEKQKQTIYEFHEMGSEVLMSAHVQVELSEEQALSLALEIESRGADIVKIIADCRSPEQALHMLNTTVTLKKHLKVPFLYGCSGYHGRMLRPLSPLFGSMLVFGHHQYTALSNFHKPLLKDMKKFFQIVDWNMFE